MNFERIALSLMGAFTAALLITASFNPPSNTAPPSRANLPRVALQDAEPLALPEATLPRTTNAAIDAAPEDRAESLKIDADFELPDFTVASGATGGTAHALSTAFGAMGYHFDKVISGGSSVPRLFLAALPEDLAAVPENKKRKALFFSSVLPLVLQVNEEILAERKRLWKLRFRVRLGNKPDAVDRLWLEVMSERYRIAQHDPVADIDALIGRVDMIPPSLALAQAAEESGWGTSRYVREGNAIFGQWTFSPKNSLVPRKRDAGKKHRVKAFARLIDSVRAYARNLNTHRAYREFRKTRAVVRRQGGPLDGRMLAGRLTSYSERGPEYVATLRGLIDTNKLQPLDDARLDNDTDGPAI